MLHGGDHFTLAWAAAAGGAEGGPPTEPDAPAAEFILYAHPEAPSQAHIDLYVLTMRLYYS